MKTSDSATSAWTPSTYEYPKPMTIHLRTWGDLACFIRPEMKVARVSYPVFTPSAVPDYPDWNRDSATAPPVRDLEPLQPGSPEMVFDQPPNILADCGSNERNSNSRSPTSSPAVLSLENQFLGANLCPMNWTETISQWRGLPAAEKLRRRWQAIPQDVAQSMAFEQEPAEICRLQEILDQIAPPDSSKPHEASSPIRS